jgi:hypothetical protein
MNGWIKPVESTYEKTRLHCSVLYGNTIYILYGISFILSCTDPHKGKGRAYCNALIKYQIGIYLITGFQQFIKEATDTQQFSAVNVNGRRPPPRYAMCE